MAFTTGDRFLVRSIVEIAETYGFDATVFADGWILRLQHGEHSRYIHGYQFELNSCGANLLANDKSAVSELLTKAEVPNVEHRPFVHPELAHCTGTSSVWNDLAEYADRHGHDVVCKPNEGTNGVGVVRARNPLNLRRAVQELFERHRTICLSPWLPIEREFRLVLLDGDCLVSYEKLRSDGEWRHNLELGAKPRPIHDPALMTEMTPLAIRAADIINARFSAVDVVLVSGSLRVLEVNTGVMLEAYARSSADARQAARDAYEHAAREMMAISVRPSMR